MSQTAGQNLIAYPVSGWNRLQSLGIGVVFSSLTIFLLAQRHVEPVSATLIGILALFFLALFCQRLNERIETTTDWIRCIRPLFSFEVHRDNIATFETRSDSLGPFEVRLTLKSGRSFPLRRVYADWEKLVADVVHRTRAETAPNSTAPVEQPTVSVLGGARITSELVIRPLGADGASRYVINGQALAFNVPAKEDESPFSDEPLEIARAVVDAFRAKALSPRGEMAFVEAACLLEKAGEKLPPFEDPNREALAVLAKAHAAADPSAAFRSLGKLGAESRASLLVYASPLFATRFPKELAAFVLESSDEGATSVVFAEELGTADPDLAVRVLALVSEESVRHTLFLEALLASIDSKNPFPRLRAEWERLSVAVGGVDRQEALVRVACREDLPRAKELLNTVDESKGERPLAKEAYVAHLAKVDPAAALAMAIGEHRSGTDDLPFVLACHRGGADVSSVLDDYIETLDAQAYKPFDHFLHLVGLTLRTEDSGRLGRTLVAGGPVGWQTTVAARDAVRALATKGSTRLGDLLDVASKAIPPGVVAGRSGSGPGLHVGHVVMRPEWLGFAPPRPVETLRIVAALGQDAPAWSSDRSA